MREVLDRLFCDCFEALAEDAFYQKPDQPPMPIRLLQKLPDLMYEVGDGRMVDTVLAGEILCTAIADPEVGDSIVFEDVTYTIFQIPIRDASQNVWKVHAIARGE